jgi:hypothetical protein
VKGGMDPNIPRTAYTIPDLACNPGIGSLHPLLHLLPPAYDRATTLVVVHTSVSHAVER